MKNYICIDGKKAELTSEQLKALGIEVKEVNPFERVAITKNYWYIAPDGDMILTKDYNTGIDCKQYKIANYCTDKELLEQRALHEILNRLLWRFSMENGGDKIDWNKVDEPKYMIRYDTMNQKYSSYVSWQTTILGVPYFDTADIAEQAIKEIVQPFMKEHPDFKW